MKKGIIVVGFLVVLLNLSAMVDSFDSAFANFMKYLGSSSDSIMSREFYKVPVSVYADFSNFLLTESCRRYSLDYILENREAVLHEILDTNLRGIYNEQSIKHLYNILLPGFCVCLMEKQEEELALRPLTPKL
jgi:hypothetical protein